MGRGICWCTHASHAQSYMRAQAHMHRHARRQPPCERTPYRLNRASTSASTALSCCFASSPRLAWPLLCLRGRYKAATSRPGQLLHWASRVSRREGVAAVTMDMRGGGSSRAPPPPPPMPLLADCPLPLPSLLDHSTFSNLSLKNECRGAVVSRACSRLSGLGMVQKFVPGDTARAAHAHALFVLTGPATP